MNQQKEKTKTAQNERVMYAYQNRIYVVHVSTAVNGLDVA